MRAPDAPPIFGEGSGAASEEPNPPTPFPKREGGARPRYVPSLGNIVRGQRVEEGKILRAKELRREMTPAEKVLWTSFRGNRLDGFHFRRQQVIDGFIADFYCHAAALVVEVDGPIHDAQPEYDADRDRVFAARGLLVLRFRNDQVFADPTTVLSAIAETCRKRISTAGDASVIEQERRGET